MNGHPFSKLSSNSSPKIETHYDIQGAYEHLVLWGWNTMYPSRPLTITMVERWAKTHKHGWRVHKGMRKLIISETDLLKILHGV